MFDLEAEITALIKREGGYSDDAEDSGGKTIFGITESVARENGYLGDMRDMPLTAAHAIYRRRYWSGPRFDAVAELSPMIAAELFDTGVNCGPGVAAGFLQRALNVFNLGGSRYPDVAEDASLGPMTLAALQQFLRWRGKEGEIVLTRALNCLQGARYFDLAHARQKDEKYVYGWLKERVA